MFRSRRPPTLSINELNQILSESLDLENIPGTVIHHDPLLLTTPKSSKFNRLFTRSSPHLPPVAQSPTAQVHEPITPSPRKMTFTWRLSMLSPRRSRPARDHAAKNVVRDSSVPVESATRSRSSSVASASQSPQRPLTAKSSSSSLGSMIPASECIFKHVAEDNVNIETENVVSAAERSQPSTSSAIAHLSPTQMVQFPSAPRSPRSPLQLLFGSKSSSNFASSRVIPREHMNSDIEKSPGTSIAELKDFESSDDDFTPRATDFPVPPSHKHSGSTIQARPIRRPSNLTLVLSQETVSLCLQPAVGATPHAPSDTESSLSMCSLPSPTTPSHVPPASSSALILASPASSTKSLTSGTSSFPWSRPRSGSRSMQTPPLPGPPPRRPLPPPPSLPTQELFTPSNTQNPLPPISPSPSKRGRTPVRSPSPSGIVTCGPSPSIGSLRLPSRLSWCATGRAVIPASSLPSPPSSPSKEGRKKEPSSGSLIQDRENNMPSAISPILAKRASVGVLEAASDLEAQVRRTKSILVLGSRRSKGMLSCSDLPPKRVQIHAGANAEVVESSPKKKPRRQSSAACTMPLLAVPRERRKSAPLLGSSVTPENSHIILTGADWTLSLPFCTDVPGGGIILPTPPSEDGALHEADEALQIAQGDDWTLSLGVERQTIANAEKEVPSDNAQIKNSMEGQSSTVTQLPTPSTTPEPQDDILPPSQTLGCAFFSGHSRPASPASLGPHCGGLDLDGGCGKRGSGWDVCGWFGPTDVDDASKRDIRPLSTYESKASWVRRSTDTDTPRRNDADLTRKCYERWARHPSEDSTATSGTVDTIYYSARTSSILVV